MKTVRMALLGLILGSVACGDDGKQSAEPGHCVREGTCTELVDGDAEAFAYVCETTGGSLGAGACDVSAYDLKCTQVSEVSEEGSDEVSEETYVTYYAESEDIFCAGEEEEL